MILVRGQGAPTNLLFLWCIMIGFCGLTDFEIALTFLSIQRNNLETICPFPRKISMDSFSCEC